MRRPVTVLVTLAAVAAAVSAQLASAKRSATASTAQATANSMILVTRKRSHPATIAYIERRLAEGKTRREANRCLKRYLARNLYRLLEHRPPIAT